MKKRRLKRWVKNTLWMILGAFLGIATYQILTIKTPHTTPVGDYTCKGGVIQICSGSKEVAEYLGV